MQTKLHGEYFPMFHGSMKKSNILGKFPLTATNIVEIVSLIHCAILIKELSTGSMQGKTASKKMSAAACSMGFSLCVCS